MYCIPRRNITIYYNFGDTTMTNLNYGYMEVHMLSTDYDMGVRLVKLFVHGWKYMVGQI